MRDSSLGNSEAAQILYNKGNMLSAEGKFEAAIASYQKAVEIEPDSAEVHHKLGEAYYALGNYAKAAEAVQVALKIRPDFAQAYKSLGNVLQAQGKLSEAMRAYTTAVEIKPEFAEAHANLGSVLYTQGQYVEAGACYQKAIALKPDLAGAYWNLGNVRYSQGRLDEAVACWQRALQRSPDLGGADRYLKLGNALLRLGQLQEAKNSYQRAIALSPDDPLAHSNLGSAFVRLGQFREAKSCYQTALTLNPDFAEVHCNIGLAIHRQSKQQGNIKPEQFNEALSHFLRAIALKPDLVEAHQALCNLINIAQKSDLNFADLREAADRYSQLCPETGKILAANAIVTTYLDAGISQVAKDKFIQIEQQIYKGLDGIIPFLPEGFQKPGLSKKPGFYIPSSLQKWDARGLDEGEHASLANIPDEWNYGLDKQSPPTETFEARVGGLSMCRSDFSRPPTKMGCSLDKLTQKGIKTLYAQLLFSMPHLRDDLAANAKLYKLIGQQNYYQKSPIKQGSFKQKSRDGKLRIGFLSSHFYRHSVGWCSADIIYNLFQFNTRHIYLYATEQIKSDAITELFKKATAKFYLPNPQNYESIETEIVKQILEDELDILVDLDSLTVPVQADILHQQPAPVCISWLGFEAPFISEQNYFIGDWYTHPAGREKYYTEQLVRMPDSFVAIAGFKSEQVNLSAERKALRIGLDQVVYLSVAPGKKLNSEIVEAQIEILKQVPDSVLLYKGRGDALAIKSAYQQACESQKVSFHRVKFIRRTETEEEHRKIYAIADVLLDSYPYNGGTHNLEALWFNLPVVTLAGEQYLARMGYSFLKTLGIDAGVARSWEEYVEWGIRYGKDADLRNRIRQQLVQSKQPEHLAPLWNPKKFAKDMYAIFEELKRK